MGGVLDVSRVKKEESNAPGEYLLRFLRPDRRKGRPVTPMTVVGNDSLERYLVEWGCTSENARGWIQKLKVSRSISIPDIVMPADRVGRYGFKVPTWGIHLDLGDGGEAYLTPDHPATLPDGKKGDRIEIRASTGETKEAWVTADGKVLIIIEEHIWPPGSPRDTLGVTIREASKEETKRIISAYKQYIPD